MIHTTIPLFREALSRIPKTDGRGPEYFTLKFKPGFPTRETLPDFPHPSPMFPKHDPSHMSFNASLSNSLTYPVTVFFHASRNTPAPVQRLGPISYQQFLSLLPPPTSPAGDPICYMPSFVFSPPVYDSSSLVMATELVPPPIRLIATPSGWDFADPTEIMFTP